MKVLKYSGYYLVCSIYYLVVFSILIFTFDPINKSQTVGPVGLMISLTAICSPFLLVKPILNRIYPGDKKKRQAFILLIFTLTLLILHIAGVQVSKSISLAQAPFYGFDICLIIALYIYKPKSQISKQIDVAEADVDFKSTHTLQPPRFKFSRGEILRVTGIILLLLIITNPSATAFKNYIGQSSNVSTRRTVNFFIFSIYESEEPNEQGNGYYSSQYVGIVGNFIEM